MSSSTSLHESWIGKLVWIFLRDENGLPTFSPAKCGIVVDGVGVNSLRVPLWIVQVGDIYYSVPQTDMEEVEDWSDED